MGIQRTSPGSYGVGRMFATQQPTPAYMRRVPPMPRAASARPKAASARARSPPRTTGAAPLMGGSAGGRRSFRQRASPRGGYASGPPPVGHHDFIPASI